MTSSHGFTPASSLQCDFLFKRYGRRGADRIPPTVGQAIEALLSEGSMTLATLCAEVVSVRWLTEFPQANDVRDWIAAHLPSGDHNCLLHSELLPQNLLYDWQASSNRDDTLVGIVDWEMARVGDPAYDLAIVSRGNRKVLGVKEGLKVLLEEYLEFGGKPISLTEVRVHELLLVLYWLEESWREHQKPATSGHGPDFYETKLASLFRRAAS